MNRKRPAGEGAGSPQARKRAREAEESAPRSCAICLLDAPPGPSASPPQPGAGAEAGGADGADGADAAAGPDADDSGQFWALREEHGCNTCKKDAWHICEECHLGRLSRQCPICRGEYAPELLYPFPTDALALPVSDLRSASTRQVLAIALLNSNTVVWTPGERVGAFCLLPSSTDGSFVCTPSFSVPEVSKFSDIF